MKITLTQNKSTTDVFIKNPISKGYDIYKKLDKLEKTQSGIKKPDKGIRIFNKKFKNSSGNLWKKQSNLSRFMAVFSINFIGLFFVSGIIGFFL